MSGLACIGDVHLQRDDPHLAAFLALLEDVGSRASRLILLGDLFTFWLGRRELEQPHHAAVVRKLIELRGRGLLVRYVEGNRDYHVAQGYVGTAFDEAGSEGLVERIGGHSLFAIHGDLANTADRKYQLWRRLSRLPLIDWGLSVLPRSRRIRLAEALERRLRTTNLAFKGAFPERSVRDYATRFFRRGHDLVVLGHFHVERDLTHEVAGTRGRIIVLPEWKGSRRHLELDARGSVRIVDSDV